MIIINEFAAYPYKYTGLERKIQFFNTNQAWDCGARKNWQYRIMNCTAPDP